MKDCIETKSEIPEKIAEVRWHMGMLVSLQLYNLMVCLTCTCEQNLKLAW